MTEKRYTIKTQDDLFGVVDSYSADKVCVVNGIRTEIEAKWLCNEMNDLNDENEFSKKRIASLNNMVLHGLSEDNLDEVIYQKYVEYTNFYDDLTRSEKMLVANFSDFLIENLFESLKKMELEE